MVSRNSRFVVGMVFLFLPLTARADGIDLPLVAGIGIGVAIPLLAFNVFVEGLVLSKFLRVDFSQIWRLMFSANLWSLAAGLPITILNAVLAETLLPEEMVRRMGVYPLAIGIGIVNYYLASVWVEFLFLRKKLCLDPPAALTKPLASGLLLGHLVTYAVLGPLFLLYATPKHTVRSFVGDTRWAAKPCTQVVFVSPQGSLDTVRTDGTGLRILLTNEVRDFVVSSDLNTILYRGNSNRYYLSRSGSVRPVPAEPLRCLGDEMDFSPEGRFVGLLDDASTGLLVWDCQTGATIKSSYAKQDTYSRPKLVWSTNENVFYVRDEGQIFKLTIAAASLASLSAAQPLGLTTAIQPELPTDLAQHYGRIGQRRNGDTNDWDVSTDAFLEEGDRHLMLLNGLSSFIRASYRGDSITISDNPGVFHFGRRFFSQAAFALDPQEIIFNDRSHLYLAHIMSRKVGLITAGNRFLLLSPLFSKSEHFAK